MDGKEKVANDVYERYGLKWADFPRSVVPSAHTDEAELFCARQSFAVYGVYPSQPHRLKIDYIPSRARRLIEERFFRVSGMIEGGEDLGGTSLEARRGFRSVASDQAGALFLWEENRLIVAFRGTANWQDWIHNYARPPVRWQLEDGEFIELHRGFNGLAVNLFPAVMQLLREFALARGSGAEIELTLCGHSLGGALALNFGLLFAEGAHRSVDNVSREIFYRHHGDNPEVKLISTYSFGAPRLGKGDVWKAVERPHFRLIVRGDPVPRTPPGYDDDFEAVYLEKPGKAAAQPRGPAGMIAKAVGSVMPRVGVDFSAHDIEGYIEAVERKIAAKG